MSILIIIKKSDMVM